MESVNNRTNVSSTAVKDIAVQHKAKLLSDESTIYKTLVTRGINILIPEKLLPEIPYLDILFSERFPTDHDEEGNVETDVFPPVLLKVILEYLKRNYMYELFICLPKEENIMDLLEMFQYLAIKPPIETSWKVIRRKLQMSHIQRNNYVVQLNPKYERAKYIFIFAEFCLCLFYAREQISLDVTQKLRDTIFNTTIYLLQENNIYPVARYHLKNLSLDCIEFTFKQVQIIEKVKIEGNIYIYDAVSISDYIDTIVYCDNNCYQSSGYPHDGHCYCYCPDKREDQSDDNIVYKTLITRGENVQIPDKLLKEIPYLHKFFSGNTQNNGEEIVETDEFNPVLLKVFLKYLDKNKAYKLFACLPKEENIMDLLELFHVFSLDPPISITYANIKKKIKDSPKIKTQVELVNYSLSLFFAHKRINLDDRKKLREKIFNTVKCVLEKTIFCLKPRARYHLKRLMLDCFKFSKKQVEIVENVEIEGSLAVSDTECHVDNSDSDSYDSYDDDGEHDYWDDSDSSEFSYFYLNSHHYLYSNYEDQYWDNGYSS